MHKAVTMQDAERLGDAREIAPQYHPVEWRPQRTNPVFRSGSAELGVERYGARLMENTKRIGSFDHADYADHHVIGAGVIHHSFDLEPLMAPKFPDLGVRVSAGL